MALKISQNWAAARRSGTKRGKGLLLGLLTAFGILTAAITLTALLVAQNKIGLQQGAEAARLCYGAAALTGCFLTARKSKEKKLLRATGAAGLFCVAVLGIRFALAGPVEGSLGSFLGITAAAWLLGSFLGAGKKRNGYA